MLSKIENKSNIFFKEKVIAEIACGHEGNLNKFKKLIIGVKNSNCKIIKSQIFIPIERSNKTHSEWKIFNKLSLTETNWIKIVKFAKKNGLVFIADIFGKESLNIALKAKVDGFKIHSENILNFKFIERVAKVGKMLLLGIGGIYRSDLILLLSFLKKKNLTKNIILMPGIQTFPTSFNSHSIWEIQDLVKKYSIRFNIRVGCADHIAGNKSEAKEFPLLALTAGASIIEKHFTLDRKLKWEDYESALDLNNFKKFIFKVKKYSHVLNEVRNMSKDEISYKKKFTKIAVAKQNLQQNIILKPKHITFTKVDNTTSSFSDYKFINKQISKKILKGQIINSTMFKQKVGAIIVVRNSSKRFPGKALAEILGKKTIEHLIGRIKKCKNINQIILATTKRKNDVIFKKIAKKNNIKFFTGDELNVSKRFLDAALKFKLDHIVRITGDDILRDEIMIDKAIISHLKNSSDVTITTNMPYGTQTEIFTLNTIKLIMDNAVHPENTEYLEWYLQNTKYFNVNFIKSNYIFNKKLRLTLDYKEDFIFFKKIFIHFKNQKNFTIPMVLKFLEKNNKLLNINSLKKTKFTTYIDNRGLTNSNEINTNLKI